MSTIVLCLSPSGAEKWKNAMLVGEHSQRALVLGNDEEAARLLSLFEDNCFQGWTAWKATDFSHARFLVQQEAGDLLILDESTPEIEEGDPLWITEGAIIPLLFLASDQSPLIAPLLRRGIHQWLPRDSVHARPEILSASLDHALQQGWLLRETACSQESLSDCQKQVTRLTNLLWQATPTAAPGHWHSQRYMMERLEEEVIRTERYGQPLAIVLGEVSLGSETPDKAIPAEEPLSPGQLAFWTAERICETKRRSDIAGQYGQDGFIMLLPSTEPTGAEECCLRVQSALESEPYREKAIAGRPLHPRFGVAHFSKEVHTAKQLLRKAEEQLTASN